jgi:hypothetical protein
MALRCLCQPQHRTVRDWRCTPICHPVCGCTPICRPVCGFSNLSRTCEIVTRLETLEAGLNAVKNQGDSVTDTVAKMAARVTESIAALEVQRSGCEALKLKLQGLETGLASLRHLAALQQEETTNTRVDVNSKLQLLESATASIQSLVEKLEAETAEGFVDIETRFIRTGSAAVLSSLELRRRS